MINRWWSGATPAGKPSQLRRNLEEVQQHHSCSTSPRSLPARDVRIPKVSLRSTLGYTEWDGFTVLQVSRLYNCRQSSIVNSQLINTPPAPLKRGISGFPPNNCQSSIINCQFFRMHVCVFANARMLKCQRTYVTLPTHLCAHHRKEALFPSERKSRFLRRKLIFLPKEINFSSEGNGNYITSECSFL